MLNELEKVWSELPFDSQWYSDNELERHRAMLSTFAQWRAQTRDELTEIGTEIDVDGTVSPGVRVRGRLDRLERDSEGRLVVVDIKTGKSTGQQGRRATPRPAGDVSARGRGRPAAAG